MHDFNYKAFEELEKTIKDCAYLAAQAQKDIRRFYKEDGSVLTQTDLRISQIVEEAVQRLFPSSTFICEESPVIRKSGEEYIFVLDPIDGTDVYSQGLPSFAIALGRSTDRGTSLRCGKRRSFPFTDPRRKASHERRGLQCMS